MDDPLSNMGPLLAPFSDRHVVGSQNHSDPQCPAGNTNTFQLHWPQQHSPQGRWMEELVVDKPPRAALSTLSCVTWAPSQPS